MAKKKIIVKKKNTIAKKKLSKGNSAIKKKIAKSRVVASIADKKKVVKKRKFTNTKTGIVKKSEALNTKRPSNKKKGSEMYKAPAPTALTFFTAKKKQKFIELLAEYGVVSYAAKGVCISRPTAYHARKDDATFAEAWDEAIETSIENMEKAAYERSVKGVDTPLTFKGKLTGDSVKSYSDILLMFLMKGNKPDKYRDNAKPVQVNLNLGADTLSNDQLSRIAQGVTMDGVVEASN